ncbi:MAG: VWA domain-containing protein [Mogibacterium sp.]|nr:VWA domain-containing protein [Mogibacterium sp.]
MGYGRWTREDFSAYSKKMNRTVGSDGSLAGSHNNQELFLSRKLDPMLDPKNVTRECCDSEDHPETVPVILALDVTGSMGQAAVEVAKELNVIMTRLYDETPDVQFMIMGIGDFAYDACPLQVSQFEADIRIAEQLDKLYFEFGGGGNYFESYTAAWYFALHHTRLDAWKRGRKGVLITMGDERLNPHIPLRGRAASIESVTGDKLQGAVETKDLYREVRRKYHLYHLNVDHRSSYDADGIRGSWREYLDKDHYRSVKVKEIADEIVRIVKAEAGATEFIAAERPDSFLKRMASGITW